MAWGQIQLNDRFQGPGWRQGLNWLGDTANFTFRPGGGLRSQDSTAAERFLFLASPLGYQAQWRFSGALDFNPSNANYLEFILMSDQAPTLQNWNGYSLRLGGTSKDRWQFMRYDAGQARLLLEGPADQLDRDSVELQVIVDRDAQGMWHIRVNHTSVDSVVDGQHWFSAYAGWRLDYTRTRADRFYLDSITLSGQKYPDSLAPRLDSFYFEGPQELKLVFNEALQPLSLADTALFQLNHPGRWLSLNWKPERPAAVMLRWDRVFKEDQWIHMDWQNLNDRFGNASQGSQIMVRSLIRAGDIQFNECMPDPSPPVGLGNQRLPEAEYLELISRAPFPVDLHQLQLQIGKERFSFPHYWLKPDSLLLLCKRSEASAFTAWAAVLGQDWGVYQLRNSGDSLSLWRQDQLIDQLVYDASYLADPAKSDGGWSLEKIDPGRPCLAAENWTFSVASSGGTPGQKNSVTQRLTDTLAPFLQDLEALAPKHFSLYFSEALARHYAPSHFTLDTALEVAAVHWWAGRSACELILKEALPAGRSYTLQLSDSITDCAGLSLANRNYSFGYPSAPDSADLLISEVLFDPVSGGSDFIELYNCSNKLLDLRSLMLSSAPQHNQRLPWSGPRTLLPQQYLALSEDPSWLIEHYSSARASCVYQQALPTLPDRKGSCYLLRSDGQVVDALHYSDQWHLPYLSNTEGISLERAQLSPLVKNDAALWHSAAYTVGGATPGRANSQQQLAGNKETLALPYRVFRPNNDGFRDQLALHYRFSGPNNWAQLHILNTQGQVVREVLSGGSLAQKGTLWWDGTNEQGLLCPRGIYLIVLRYRDSAHRERQLRLTAVLSR